MEIENSIADRPSLLLEEQDEMEEAYQSNLKLLWAGYQRECDYDREAMYYGDGLGEDKWQFRDALREIGKLPWD